MAVGMKTAGTLKLTDVSAKPMLHLQDKIIIYILKTKVEDSSEM
jgi:competence transcription factor ComK